MKQQSQSKAIIFDSGTLISFSMNGVTDILEKLRGIFDGKFIITPDVKREVIDRPLQIKKFSLEALKIKHLLDMKILELPSSIGLNDKDVARRTSEMLDRANSTYRGGRDIHVIDYGEASCLAVSKMLSEKGIENVIAVDERTTRMLVEKPENLKDLLERKLHTRITLVKKGFESFKNFKVIRSVELIYVSWKKGLVELKDGNYVLDALLYALKFKGCAVSSEEIEEIKKMK